MTFEQLKDEIAIEFNSIDITLKEIKELGTDEGLDREMQEQEPVGEEKTDEEDKPDSGDSAPPEA